MTEILIDPEAKKTTAKIVDGLLGENKRQELKTALKNDTFYGPEGKGAYLTLLKEFKQNFNNQVEQKKSQITSDETFQKAANAEDLLKNFKDQGSSDLITPNSWTYTKNFVLGKNALTYPGGGSNEAQRKQTGFNRAIENPLTRQWVHLSKEADKKNPDILKNFTAEVLAITSILDQSEDVQSISQADADFFNKSVDPVNRAVSKGDVMGVSDPEAIGRGVRQIWAADEHLNQSLDGALKNILGATQNNQRHYEEADKLGVFSNLKSDLQLPETLTKGLYWNAYNLTKINGFGGVILESISNSKSKTL